MVVGMVDLIMQQCSAMGSLGSERATSGTRAYQRGTKGTIADRS